MATFDDITPETAEALLNRDTRNRVERLAKRGGLLSESDRKKLRAIARLARKQKRRVPKQVLQGQLSQTSTKEPQFEGTWLQRVRRRKVYQLRLRNYTIRDMAAELECSPMTVQSDLKAIDETLRQAFDPVHATEIVNEALADFDAVRLIAIEQLNDVDGERKVGLLNAILYATKAKIELLQDFGTLPKKTKRLELSGADGAPLPLATPGVTVVIGVTRALPDSPPVTYEIVDAPADAPEPGG